MQNLQLDEGSNSYHEDEGAIFQSQEHFEREISRLCHGDLYVIGRLWIQALRTVLVGANLSLIPVVKAAKNDEIPQKPPKMKYKDLPIYESPHYEYKDYMEDQKKSPHRNVKILHTYLFPKVASWRKSWADSIYEFNKDARELKDDACGYACKKKDDFITYMRCPKNIVLRQAILVTGAATGYYIGRGRSSLKALFFTTLGALSAGALCFPDETDEIFRSGSYRVGKFAVALINTVCGRNFVWRERVPCRDDLPPPPPPRPAHEKNKCDNVQSAKPTPIAKPTKPPKK